MLMMQSIKTIICSQADGSVGQNVCQQASPSEFGPLIPCNGKRELTLTFLFDLHKCVIKVTYISNC